MPFRHRVIYRRRLMNINRSVVGISFPKLLLQSTLLYLVHVLCYDVVLPRHTSLVAAVLLSQSDDASSSSLRLVNSCVNWALVNLMNNFSPPPYGYGPVSAVFNAVKVECR